MCGEMGEGWGGGGGGVNRKEGEESSLAVLFFLEFSDIARRCPGFSACFCCCCCFVLAYCYFIVSLLDCRRQYADILYSLKKK